MHADDDDVLEIPGLDFILEFILELIWPKKANRAFRYLTDALV